jgi:flagellar motor switch protein FliN/FliY
VLESSNVKRLQLVDLQGSPSEVMFDIQIADPESITQDWTEEDALMMNPPGMPTASQSSPRPGGATGGENKANLWDNLIIDLKAEFEPVKMPLNQLKQISEGLIVEVGDLIHNRIRLHVDNKTLAHGELLIIGDKFAVKITDIEAERKPPGQSPAMTGGGPADMGMAAGLPGMPGGMMPGMSDMDQQPDGGSDEMADLDDFLNTDFDAQDENNGEGW